MKKEVKIITPEIAKELLKFNKFNRPYQEKTMLRYYVDMMNDLWITETGESIKISKKGNLLDGQHRLYALIKANKPYTFLIISELDEDIMPFIDTGKSRSYNDCLAMNGVKNYVIIGSVIQFYKSLKENRFSKPGVYQKYNNFEVLNVYENRNKFWDEVALFSQRMYNAIGKLLPKQVIGGFYSYLYEIDQEKAKNFILQVCTGENIENQTIYILRKRLILEAVQLRKSPIKVVYAFLIKAWNCYIKNEEIKIMKWDATKEEFPKIVNKNINNSVKHIN